MAHEEVEDHDLFHLTSTYSVDSGTFVAVLDGEQNIRQGYLYRNGSNARLKYAVRTKKGKKINYGSGTITAGDIIAIINEKAIDETIPEPKKGMGTLTSEQIKKEDIPIILNPPDEASIKSAIQDARRKDPTLQGIKDKFSALRQGDLETVFKALTVVNSSRDAEEELLKFMENLALGDNRAAIDYTQKEEYIDLEEEEEEESEYEEENEYELG